MGTLRLSNTMLRTHALNNVKKNLFSCCFGVLTEHIIPWLTTAKIF